MTLRFLGEWSLWAAAPAALAAALLAWFLYRRETRAARGFLSWLLPVLRALAVFGAVFILAGPLLHHRKVLGERARVLVFLDASQSMRLTDDTMEPARKLLFVHRAGWVPPGTLDTRLVEAADAVARARRAGSGAELTPAAPLEAARAFARELEAGYALLSKVRPETTAFALERKGVILREFWKGLPGGEVDALRNSPRFREAPSGTSLHELFEAPVDWADDYGTRMRGFVHPPETGNYVFWIASDDQSELWLSPDESPDRKVLVARTPVFAPPRGWDTAPEQKSKPVRLDAGRKYYIEALHKEGSGGDSVSVGWQLPGGTMERPIPAPRLSAPVSAQASPAEAFEAKLAAFREKLLSPAQTLAGKRQTDPANVLNPLHDLLKEAARWEKDLRDDFANYAARVAAAPDARLKAAIEKFDALPRWKRAEAILSGGPKGLLEQLAEKHHVELLTLGGAEPQTLWSSQNQSGEDLSKSIPRALPPEPSARTTNLSDGLRARVGDKDEERSAAILFSDGQHNDGSSPLQTAKILGNRRIPVYTVGMGGLAQPEDLAVLRVKGPETLFYKDRVKGEIVLKDDMAPGKPFTVRVECQGQVLWEKALTTDRSHLRTVPYDFPVQTLVEKMTAVKEKDLQVLSQPLAMKVTLSAVEGEREKGNNEMETHTRAVMHRRKLLILEGRPRWEFRYLRNLFERDEQWEVNAVLADNAAGTGGWPRGDKPGTFPADREALLSCDLIVFGEVPRQCLKIEELQWIRDFVEKRGGGLIVIDGRRGHVASYAETKEFGPLLPVDWKGESVGGRPSKLRLTERGAQIGHLSLSSGTEANDDLWASLQPPHWVAPAKAQQGAEVLLEAMVGERAVPALVTRRVGAGRVLFGGFDESWRWRYEVGDPHHQRFWNQMARWIMEPPFAVKDSRVSLDAGKVFYAHGERAEIRARLRDAQGRPVEKAAVEALLVRDGQKAGSVKLSADENSGGIFTGLTAPLQGGRYEVRVRAEGFSETETRVRTEFTVRSRDAGELASLGAHEELLRQMAAHSGGEFLREEEASSVASRLEPMSREKVVESTTILWQSYAWFLPLVLLLSVEWILRKWAGML
jgi:hypothetical protein